MQPVMIERQAWGTRVKMMPFSAHPKPSKAAMTIVAEVAKPDTDGRVETKVHFTGTGVTEPLKGGDVVVWLEAFKAVNAKALEVADKFKGKKPAKATKKVAKKKAKKA